MSEGVYIALKKLDNIGLDGSSPFYLTVAQGRKLATNFINTNGCLRKVGSANTQNLDSTISNIVCEGFRVKEHYRNGQVVAADLFPMIKSASAEKVYSSYVGQD